jgi:hypothetical protein
MHISIGRRSRLTALGAGLITAAAIAVSASGPALADTADTGGSASLAVPVAVVVGLAHANIAMLPGTPATSSFDPRAGTDTVTSPVTGGNAEVSNFYGILKMGGSLFFINGSNGKRVKIRNLQLNLFTGTLQGVFPGSTTVTTLAFLVGTCSTSSDPGPPATETLTCDQLNLSTKAATALNTDLVTKVFRHGTDIGAFTTTFDVTVS